MKLEDQVVSLELAKKLKELGVKQESLFYWNTRHIWVSYYKHIKKAPVDFGDEIISAYTVAELGEMLPSDVTVIETDEKCHFLAIETTGYGKLKKWYLSYGDRQYLEHEADTEADARASMLIYLLENKLITL